VYRKALVHKAQPLVLNWVTLKLQGIPIKIRLKQVTSQSQSRKFLYYIVMPLGTENWPVLYTSTRQLLVTKVLNLFLDLLFCLVRTYKLSHSDIYYYVKQILKAAGDLYRNATSVYTHSQFYSSFPVVQWLSQVWGRVLD